MLSRERAERGSRLPYVVVGLIAAVPLVELTGAAPTGHDWVMLEFPYRITLLALALGMLAIAGRSGPRRAWLVLLGTPAIAFVWAYASEYAGLAKYGRTDLLGSEVGLLFQESVGRLAPWLMAGAYGTLAWLAHTRRAETRANRVRAGGWLAAAGLVATALAMANDSWLTLANLSQSGTEIAHMAWPDTKILTVACSLVAVATGVLLVASGLRHTAPPIPRATIHREIP